jgi:hypothetical protein
VASDSRALTLKLLADTADFQKKLASGSKDIDSIGERAAEFGKKAAVAFAAAGAAIGAFAASAIKNAAEDEAAQRKLALTIENSTNAKKEQIAAVEDYITKTSLAVGVTDDQLRPAFARLVRSTKDIEDATNLLNLALDISAATGKPLETVSMALGKAYDGNAASLGRLGLGVDANILKSKDFNLIFKELTNTFGNFAENEATSTEKQMERVKIALDEAKESIGAALLPVVQELTAWILQNFIPALEAFISGLTGSGGLDESLTDTQKTAIEWGQKVRGFIDTVIDLKDELLLLGGILGTVFVVSKIAAGVQATILLIQGLVAAYVALRNSATAAAIASRFALNPLAGLATGAAVVTAIVAAIKMFDNISGSARNDLFFPTGGTGRQQLEDDEDTRRNFVGLTPKNYGTTSNSTITSSKTPTQTLIEQVSEANFIKRTAGTGSFDVARVRLADENGVTGSGIGSNFNVARARFGEERGNVVINVNAPSVIDEEGFSRAVQLALNNSSRRLGGGGDQLIL